MTDIKFSGKEDEILIEFVACNPPLFDPHVESYKHGNVRDNIWKDIANKLNKSEGDCKKRWKHIRDSYNRSKRKKKESSTPSKNSKWQLFSKLQFLERVLPEKNACLEESGATVSPVAGTSVINEKIESEEKNGDDDTKMFPNSSSPPPLLVLKKNPAKKRKESNDDVLEFLKNREENRELFIQELSNNDVVNNFNFKDIEDDVNSFGNHVKTILRKLNARLKIQAKREIFNVLTKYEMIQTEMQEETAISNTISNQNLSSINPQSNILIPETQNLQNEEREDDFKYLTGSC